MALRFWDKRSQHVPCLTCFPSLSRLSGAARKVPGKPKQGESPTGAGALRQRFPEGIGQVKSKGNRHLSKRSNCGTMLKADGILFQML